MKQKFISAIAKCGFVEGKTIILQGTLAADIPYPDTFVTIWTNYTADNSHFDNDVSSVEWNFTLILYSTDPETLSKKAKELLETLRAVGFIPQGKGQDIPSDEPTHTGWTMDFLCVEYF